MSGSVLCPLGRYQLYTGDYTTSDSAVGEATSEAEGLIAEFLGRAGISRGTYTERLRIFYDPAATGLFGPSGWVYPTAKPVVSVSVPTGVTVLSDGVTVRDVSPDADPIGLFGSPIQLDRHATLTYVGGWTAATCPREIVKAIARTARNLSRVFQPGEGALVSVRQGDSAVTYARAGAATEAVDAVTQQSIKGWRHRQV